MVPLTAQLTMLAPSSALDASRSQVVQGTLNKSTCPIGVAVLAHCCLEALP